MLQQSFGISVSSEALEGERLEKIGAEATFLSAVRERKKKKKTKTAESVPSERRGRTTGPSAASRCRKPQTEQNILNQRDLRIFTEAHGMNAGIQKSSLLGKSEDHASVIQAFHLPHK